MKTYTESEIIEIIDQICEIIEDGNSLRYALKEKDLNSRKFYEWIDSNKDFAKQYARACELRAEAMADELLEISDEKNADAYLDDTGAVKIDGNAIQRSRLKVDTRKWLMAKMAPKKYGDQTQIDVTTKGKEIGNNSIKVEIVKSDEGDNSI